MQEYPKMRWSTDGVARVVGSPKEDDPSFLDHHPSDGAAKESMSRKEIIAALNEGGVVVPKSAKTAKLADLLRASLVQVLDARGIRLDSSASISEMLFAARGGRE